MGEQLLAASSVAASFFSRLCVLVVSTVSSSIVTAPRATPLKMPKLNGGRVNARTNSALPDHHLPYDEQQLEVYQAHSADSAVEAELLDSPLTKRLRKDQECQNNSVQQAAVPEPVEIKLLARPSSGGHNIEARGFALLPPPKVKAQAARAAEPTKFFFAPIHKELGNVQDGSVEQDRPGSRIPTTE